MQLSSAIEGFLYVKAATLASGTVTRYRYTLTQWSEFLAEDIDVNELDHTHFQRYLYYIRVDRKLAPKTVKNTHLALSSFCTWLESETGIPHLIRGRIKTPKAQPAEVIPLTKSELKLLLLSCDRSAANKRVRGGRLRKTRYRDRAIILFLVDTGVRASELCALVVSDVDMETGAIQVRKGKGGKSRTVYMGALVREALWRYLSKRQFKRPDDPLFATDKHGHMDRNILSKMLSATGKRADIAKPVRPHRFRHTFAINYLKNGGDIFTLQRMLGHSSIEMVKRYLAIAQVDVAEAHGRASPVDNWRLT